MIKKTLAFVIAAMAICHVNAQDIKFNYSGEGRFASQMPLSEIKSIKHCSDTDGNDIVTAESKNGAVYTAKASELSATTTQVEDFQASDFMNRSKYANMKEKFFNSKIDELETGDLAGIVDELDYSVEELTRNTYYTYNSYFTSIYSLVVSADSTNAANLALANGTTIDNIRIHIADIVYISEGMNGQKIPLSARLIYPYNIKNNDLNLTKIYVDNHTTCYSKFGGPTSYLSYLSPLGVCTKGYLIVQPDLQGFGASADRTQIYIDANLNGAAVAYSVVAAQQYADWAYSQSEYGFKLTSDASLIIEGESQGATTAISGTYYIENKLDNSKYNIPEIEETRCCGGAYNMKTCMDEYCKVDTLVFPISVPMLLPGSICCNPDVFGSYTTSDYFDAQMRDTEYLSNENYNYGTIWQMLDQQYYDSSIIKNALLKLYPSEEHPGNISVRKMMAQGLVKDDNTLDWSDPRLVALGKYFDQNNFASKTLWTPQSNILIVHADKDQVVPYSTAEEFYNNQNYRVGLLSNRIELKTLEDVPTLSFGSNHGLTCLLYTLSELTGLSIVVLNDMVKVLLNFVDV